MSQPIDDTEPIEELAKHLADYDDELRQGRIPNQSNATTVAATFQSASSSLVNCLHLLERTWPRHGRTENPETPASIGRFQVERVLGVGGFGLVYKAFDPRLHREIALKVPRPHLRSNHELLERFEREAKAAASLDHPNIVPVYETGQEGKYCYIAAAYCSGPNLAEWLRSQKSPVPILVAVNLIRELAAAIEYSHAKGILHRDLKPGNVLLAPHTGILSQPSRDKLNFVPRLTDFGLAKSISSLDQSPIGNDAVMGTPSYMAPEQTRTNELISPGADIYGLGAILYELLTGRPPFQGTNTLDLFDQICTAEPVAPSRLRREISNDLDTICMKCLEKNSSNRFLSAKEFVEELDRYLRGEPIKSRPIGLLRHGLKWCRRRPAAAALIAVTMTAIVVINGLLAFQNRTLVKLNGEITKYSDNLALYANNARSLQQIAEENERKTKAFLYAADISRAAAAWKDEDPRVMTELLDRHIPKPGTPDRRGFEWWFLHQQSDHAHRILLDTGSACYILQPTPDRRRMAVAGLDANVRLFDPLTGEILLQFPTSQIEVNGLAFSPNQNELATAGDDGTIRFWNLATGSERLKINAHRGKVYQLVFNRNGHEIFSCGDDPIIRVFDVQSGEERHRLVGHDREVQSLSISADGKTFASTSTDSTVKIWDVDNKRVLHTFGHYTPLSPIVLRQDRDLMLVGSDQGELLSCQFSSPSLIATVKHPDGIDSIDVHPNGKMVATGTGGGSIHCWNLGSKGELSEASFQPWQAHQGNVHSLAWTADGTRLISAGKDGRVISWNLLAIQSTNPRKIEIPSTSLLSLIPKTDLLFHSQASPDPSTISVVNWRTGTKHPTSVGEGYDFNEVAVSPDGRFVAGMRKQKEIQLFQIQFSADRIPSFLPLANWTAQGVLSRIRFSADSSSLAVSHWYRRAPEEQEEHFVWLLSLPDFVNRVKVPIPNAKAMAFSPDAKTLLLATQAGLTLWDLERGNTIWDIPKSEQGYLAFSSNGQKIATGGEDRQVVIRNASDGAVRFRLSGHRGRLRGLLFSKDDRTLASIDSEGTLKLWCVDVGQELFELRNPDMTGVYFDFSSDGTHLLLHLWPGQQNPNQDLQEMLIYSASDDDS